MNVLLVLIPLSLVLVLLAVGVFVWAVRKGQFDDLDTPALRILQDDDGRPPGAARGAPPADAAADPRTPKP